MNRLVLTFALSILLIAPGCGSAPTAPSESSRSLAGKWILDWRVDTCQGARHCFAFRGTHQSTVLRLAQTGRALEGVLEVGYGVPVAGEVSPEGEAVLRGQAPAVGAMDSVGAIDAVVAVRRDLQRGLVGTIRYESRPTYNPEVFGVHVRAGEIVGARPAASPRSPLTGTWRGRYIVRRCVPAGWPTCAAYAPDSIGLYEMILAESGPEVTGSLTLYSSRDFPSILGSLQGSTLTLTAPPFRRVVSGGVVELRLIRWVATLERFGRMSGSFTFVDEFQRGTGGVLSYTVEADLLGVTRSP